MVEGVRSVRRTTGSNEKVTQLGIFVVIKRAAKFVVRLWAEGDTKEWVLRNAVQSWYVE